MTNLTELWKKGELPNGYYWIRLSWGDMVIMAYHTSFDGLFELDDHYYDEDEISEILAPVPSYEEWDKLNNTCHELEKETACLTVDIVNLKELLKECRELLSDRKMYGINTCKTWNILVLIDEVLK